MKAIYARLTTHYAVVQSFVPMLTKAGKPDSHESPVKYKVELLYGFSMSIGMHASEMEQSGRVWRTLGQPLAPIAARERAKRCP